MTTSKHRVNITLDDDLFHTLNDLSKKRDKSMSNLGAALIEKAIELEEDLHFSRVADARISDSRKRVSHERAWK